MAVEIEKRSSVRLSKVAVSKTHGEDSPYFAGWKAYDENPYDEVHNQSGVIQMGLAENQVRFRVGVCQLVIARMSDINTLFFVVQKQVSFDLLEKYLEEHHEVSSWGKGAPGFRENALFQDYHGLKSFRQVPSFVESKPNMCVYVW